jgi:hypothetical protein
MIYLTTLLVDQTIHCRGYKCIISPFKIVKPTYFFTTKKDGATYLEYNRAIYFKFMLNYRVEQH